MRQTRAHDFRCTVRVEIVLGEVERRSHALGIGPRAEPRRKLPHPYDARFEIHLDRELARGDDLRDGGSDPLLRSKYEGGAEARVPGERKLCRGGEDSHPVPAGRHFGHERGLGEADLERDRLHHLRRQSWGVRDHTELVPGERRVREHVHEVKGDPHELMLRPGLHTRPW